MRWYRRIFVCVLWLISLSLHAQQIYVVAAGVSDYQFISDLILPVKDAKAMAGLFQVHTKNVVLLTGNSVTKEKLTAALRTQFSRAGKDDMVVFAFSGHGYQGGFCPYDMMTDGRNGLSYSEIQQIFKSSRAGRKVILADACFAGGLRSGSRTKSSVPDIDQDEILLFLSSRSGEASIESPRMANGFFTAYLIRGLRGGADANKDRKITALELFTFVSKGVKERSKNKQHPVMWGKFENNLVVMDWNK